MEKNKQKKRHLYWILQIFGWSAFSLINLTFKYLFTKEVTYSDITLTFLVLLLGVFFSHMIRFVYKHFNWPNLNLATILHKVAILAVFTGLTNLCVLYGLVSFCPQTVHHSFGIIGFSHLAMRFSVVYFVWGVLYFTVYFFTNFKKAEIINLQNKAQLNEIHLNKLKSQLNPHFMFNAMNVIRALIDEDSDKAKDGITQLSNILRQTLNVNQEKLIPLREELKILHDYLSLEKLRFEERLNWEINIPENTQNTLIPPMLLQTLVENSIKHGLSSLIEGGTISIKSKTTNDDLEICVKNSGQYTPKENQQGFGLKNSKERLKVIFKERASLDIKNSSPSEVVACIRLPLKFKA